MTLFAPCFYFPFFIYYLVYIIIVQIMYRPATGIRGIYQNHIQMSRFIATLNENAGSALLQPGRHLCAIKTAADTLSKPNDMWKDRTPQVEVVFEDTNGKIITGWYNLKGYQKQDDFADGKAPKGFEFRSSEGNDEQYLVDLKTGNRVESLERTEQALKIFTNMANDAGIGAGEGFELSDLTGLPIGVQVRAKNQSVEIHYTMPAKRVEAEEFAA